MLLKGMGRAAACAVFGMFAANALGQQEGQQVVRGSGEIETFATVDIDGLSAAPRYAYGQGLPDESPAETAMRSQNLVLVPLPAPLWVATSGLASLALIAAWKKHRLRSE